MGNLGGGEIILILLIALLIFGPSKLSSMGKGLGEGLKNFKKGLSQDDNDEPPRATESKRVEPPKALPAAQKTVVESPSATPESQPAATESKADDPDAAEVRRRDG